MLKGGSMGQISFVSDVQFSFGAEFSVLGQSLEDKNSTNCIRVVCEDLASIDVRVEDGEPVVKRYVVISRRTNGTDYVLYEALPADSIVEEAESVECAVLERLRSL